MLVQSFFSHAGRWWRAVFIHWLKFQCGSEHGSQLSVRFFILSIIHPDLYPKLSPYARRPSRMAFPKEHSEGLYLYCTQSLYCSQVYLQFSKDAVESLSRFESLYQSAPSARESSLAGLVITWSWERLSQFSRSGESRGATNSSKAFLIR